MKVTKIDSKNIFYTDQKIGDRIRIKGAFNDKGKEYKAVVFDIDSSNIKNNSVPLPDEYTEGMEIEVTK